MTQGASALPANPLALHGPPADVAAAEAFGPVDAVGGRVSAGLRLRDAAAEGGDAEDAAAGGEDAVAVPLRAGMEDGDALDGVDGVQAADLRALGVVARIAACGHHHAEGRVVVPAQVERSEAHTSEL